jgi:polyferredoxin
VTLANINSVVLTLVTSLVILALIFLLLVLLVARAFSNRLVPQSAIDELAELRSAGISVLMINRLAWMPLGLGSRNGKIGRNK